MAISKINGTGDMGRRFADAAMFGLYADPSNVTTEEAAAIVNFLTSASPSASACDGGLGARQANAPR